MSTSLLVNKMRKAAEEQGIRAEIDAVPESQLKNNLNGLDVVLIGPQVRYLEKKVRDLVEPRGVQVDIIDTMAYGMVQGDKVLNQAIDLAK